MKTKRSRARSRRDPRRVERAHPAVRAPRAESARVRRSAVHLAARAAPPVQQVLRRQLDRHAAVRAGLWSHRRLILWCRCRGGTRYCGRVAQRTALRNPRVIFCRSKPRRRVGRRRRGPTRPRPLARHGDDSDCFYCGDFDSEEEIAHYLDLDDEWGITKSWALVL